MARKTTDNLLALAVTVGGIFGLIVDTPDVFQMVGRLWGALSEVVRSIMSREWGYWILIIGGLTSLLRINLDRIRETLRRWRGDDTSRSEIVRTGTDLDLYIVATIRTLCDKNLDDASYKLQHLTSERVRHLQRAHPDIGPFFCASNELIRSAVSIPRDRLHNELVRWDDGNNPITAQEASALLRDYIDGYLAVAELLTRAHSGNLREFVQSISYKEWRAKHNEVRRAIEHMAADKNLHVMQKKFRCLPWPDLKD